LRERVHQGVARVLVVDLARGAASTTRRRPPRKLDTLVGPEKVGDFAPNCFLETLLVRGLAQRAKQVRIRRNSLIYVNRSSREQRRAV
jgi:hypothetical protein